MSLLNVLEISTCWVLAEFPMCIIAVMASSIPGLCKDWPAVMISSIALAVASAVGKRGKIRANRVVRILSSPD